MRKRTLCALAGLLGAVACSSDDGNGVSEIPDTSTDTETERTIEVLSYWARSGDAEALQALMNAHESAHPNDVIVHTPEAANWSQVLAERVAAGNPPDVFLLHDWELGGFFEQNGTDALQPLDDLLDDVGARTSIYSELLDGVTVEGKVYGMPVAVARINVLYYNKHVFTAQELAPPTTFEELLAACEQLDAAGITPLAVRSMSMLFDGVLAGTAGLEAFYDFKQGDGMSGAMLAEAVETHTLILDEYLDPTNLTTTLFDPPDDMQSAFMHDEVAMYIDGDWSAAAFEQQGWTPGVDFGVIPFPGTEAMFSYSTDIFTIPASASELEGAYDFLATAGSKEGQEAFAALKRSAPVRSDAQVVLNDSERQNLIEDLQQATYRVGPIPALFPMLVTLQDYAAATERDKEGLAGTLMGLHQQ